MTKHVYCCFACGSERDSRKVPQVGHPKQPSVLVCALCRYVMLREARLSDVRVVPRLRGKQDG